MPKKSKLEKGEPVNVHIKKFNMSSIKDNKVILFIGKRGTGKSILVLDYLYHHRDFPLGTVISPTDEYNQTYCPHVPAVFIHEEYTPELLDQLLQRQKDICTKVKKNPAYAGVDPRTFIIFDDCLANSQDWVKDKTIRWIFMNGRHAATTFILTMQYCMGIPPSLRTNVDYIFICKEPKLCNQERLYKQFAGIFPCLDMFRVVLNKCTKNFGCLVIDNCSNSDRLEDQVFWYRADVNRPQWDNYKLCYPIFWKNNEIFLEGKGEKKEDRYDFDQLGTRRNQINFNVKQIE